MFYFYYFTCDIFLGFSKSGRNLLVGKNFVSYAYYNYQCFTDGNSYVAIKVLYNQMNCK